MSKPGEAKMDLAKNAERVEILLCNARDDLVNLCRRMGELEKLGVKCVVTSEMKLQATAKL